MKTCLYKLLLLLAIIAAIAVCGCSDTPPQSTPSTPEITVPEVNAPDREEAEALRVATKYTNSELEEWYGVNTDFIGILEIPAIGMRELVVTCPDGENNNDFYLRRDIYKKNRHLGIIYFDYRCLTDGTWGENNVLYGHNVGKSKYSDDMFGKLAKYVGTELWENADLVKFTAYNGYTYYFQIVSGYSTSPKANGDKYFCITANFDEDRAFHYTDMRRYGHFDGFLSKLIERSDFDSGVNMHFYDKILTLVTCIYEPEDYRYILHAKLLDTDEVKAYFAENPTYYNADEIVGNPLPF